MTCKIVGRQLYMLLQVLFETFNMETRFLSIETDSYRQNQCVNAYEVYMKQLFVNSDKVYFENWKQVDLVNYAESTYRDIYDSLKEELDKFKDNIILVHGPRSIIIESIQMRITIGTRFSIELTILDNETNEEFGSIDLANFFCFTDNKTGATEIILKDNAQITKTCIRLENNRVLAIRIKGAIRPESPVALVAKIGV